MTNWPLTSQALRDLDDICDWIEVENVAAADRVVEEIIQPIERLPRFKGLIQSEPG
jgi:plasmid stabilization system protein ParE